MANNYVITEDGELCHYGVKGMKWGVRKFNEKSAELDKKKAAYKKANKAYNKAFRNAENRNLGSFSPIKKHRENSQKRWEDVAAKAKRADQLKKEYKSAKKEFNKNTTVGQKIGRGANRAVKVLGVIGKMYAADLAFTGGKTTRMVTKGTKVVAKMAKDSVMDKMFNASILDAAGNVLYRYNM